MKKVKTKKLSFGFTRIDLVDGNKRTPMLGVWKRRDRIGTYYENDRNGRIFRSMKAVKDYVLGENNHGHI